VKPKCFLRCRFPHVAQLALPRAGVLRRARADAPAEPNLVSHLSRNEPRRPFIHWPIARCIHNEIGRKLLAIHKSDGRFRKMSDFRGGLQFDAAVHKELGSSDIDVIARAPTQIHGAEAGAVLPERQHETGGPQTAVKGRILLLNSAPNWDLEYRSKTIRHRSGDQVRLVDPNSRLLRLL
jgi:hypothetical protein